VPIEAMKSAFGGTTIGWPVTVVVRVPSFWIATFGASSANAAEPNANSASATIVIFI